MEFTIEKEALIKGLGKTQSIIEKKNTLQILSNVLIEARGESVEFVATDLEIGIKGKYEAKIKTPGSVTVGARKLFEIVRELSDEEVNIKTRDNNWVEISSGKAKFNIVGLAADEFPTMLSYEDKDFFGFPSEMISEMIEKVQHAISTDETRYYLNGVYFLTVEKDEKPYLRMVATDGHRLGLTDRPVPEGSGFTLEKGCIIPRKGIVELKKALSDFDGEAQLCFKDRNLIVKCDNLLFVIRLIDGEFPEYNQVIPAGNDRHITCSRDQIFGGLRRVSLLSSELNRGVKLSLSKKNLKISSSNPDVGEAEEEMAVVYEGEKMSVGFNARYFIDVLSVVRDEDVVIELADELSPAIIRTPSDPDYLAVIMPMRL
jgi:DNA polymerase III subunit beta